MSVDVPEDGQNLDHEFMMKISNLVVASDALSKEVPDLVIAVRRNRLTMRMIMIGFLLFLLVLIGSTYALYAEHQTNDQLKANVASVQNLVASDTRTNNDVLCPLYSAFVASFTPAQRAQQPPSTLAFYDKAVASIKKAYETLGCPAGAVP